MFANRADEPRPLDRDRSLRRSSLVLPPLLQPLFVPAGSLPCCGLVCLNFCQPLSLSVDCFVPEITVIFAAIKRAVGIVAYASCVYLLQAGSLCYFEVRASISMTNDNQMDCLVCILYAVLGYRRRTDDSKSDRSLESTY